MNLFKVGISGISVAEAHINTTAHNISNLTTPGYSRQAAMVSSAGSQATSAGYIGRGVKADTVMRHYDQFLQQQLQTAQGKGAEVTTQARQLQALASTVADRTVGISPALNDFFTSLNALASTPSVPAVRQDVIGKSNTLVSQINGTYAQLQTVREDMNAKIRTSVEQANSFLHRIAELNQQIINSRGPNGQVSNDLLDQRDQALSELNMIVGVQYSSQGDGVNVSLLGGQSLIAGTSVFELQAVASSADPQRVSVAVTVPGSENDALELKDSRVDSGELGGLMRVRADTLDEMQSRIGQMAVGLALSFNAVHGAGKLANGQDGGAFFGIGTPDVLNNLNNTGGALIGAEYSAVGLNFDGSSEPVRVTGHDYEISFVRASGGNPDAYQVRNLTTGEISTLPYDDSVAEQTLTIDGLDLRFTGEPEAGDKWTLMSTRNAARDLSLAVGTPEEIAAAGDAGGASNGENALKLAGLQNKRLFDGDTASVTEIYAKTVNTLGVDAQAALAAQSAQAKLVTQKANAQQAISGVNANEEYSNLVQYQAAYQASAKIIDTARTLFDTLLSLKS